MKIGYVVDVFPKLSEAFILNEITELQRRGVEVIVFSLNNPKERVTHTEYDKKAFSGKVYYPPCDRLPAKNVLAPKNFSTLLGSTFTEKPHEKVQNILKAKFFAEIARREKIDFLHAHFAAGAGATAMYMSNAVKIPYVITVHAFCIFSRPNRPRARRVLRNAERIITISDYNKKYIHDVFGIDAGKITVIRSGIDTAKFRPAKAKKLPVFTVFSVGRAVEKKGFEYLIEAMSLLKKRKVKARAVIVTSGPLHGKLLLLVSEKRLGDTVKLMSEITDEELIDYYHKSHVFVLPCVAAKNGDMDGIPGVFFECMSAGLPVISTRISGIPELIDSGKNGLLVGPRDAAALAAAIEKVYSDRKLLAKLAARTRETILEKHNLTKQGAKWVALFKSL